MQSLALRWEMNSFFRFCYLNFYSFLLLFLSFLIITVPLYKITAWFLIPQLILAVYVFVQSVKLFSTWQDKKLKYKILMGKNKDEFRPDTFEQFMQMPCGRLLTKIVLKDLGKKSEYKNLLKYKTPFLTSIKNNFVPQKTVIYINEEIK